MAGGTSHAIVVTDMPAGTDFAGMPKFAGYERLTILPLHHDHGFPDDTERVRFRPPGVFTWHEAFGRTVHQDLERLSWRVADRVDRHGSILVGAPAALRFLLLDAVLWQYHLMRRVDMHLDTEGGNSDVLLYFADRDLSDGIGTMLAMRRKLALDLVRTDPASDTKSLRLQSEPKSVGLPLGTRLVRQLGRTGKVVWRQYRRLQSRGYLPTTAGFKSYKLNAKQVSGASQTLNRKMAGLAASLTSENRSAKAWAVLCWNCRDRNYSGALLRAAREVLNHRPALFILEGKADAAASEIERFASESGHEVRILRMDEISQLSYGHGDGAAAEITEALSAVGFDPDLLPADAAILRHVAQSYVREHASVRTLAATISLMSRLEPLPLAYGLFASGRSATFAAIAEHMAARHLPTVDVHIYLVGNHARQLAPPTAYAAVIDDQQEALVSSFWEWSANRCIRVGYLWREARGAGEVTPSLAETDPVVAICTQPGETAMVRGFFSDVMLAMRGLNPGKVIVKPHPAEGAAILSFYQGLIRNHPLSSRIILLDGNERLTDILETADLVVTRTSNAGIEAALMGKPTLRYLAYDLYDRSVEHVVAYARTINSLQELRAGLSELVDNPQARRQQVEAQSSYLDENPAQVAADGARRLVEFIESKVLDLPHQQGRSMGE